MWKGGYWDKSKQVKVSEQNVKAMKKRGWRAKMITHHEFTDLTGHLAGDCELGYVLCDSTGYIISPQIRQYIGEAWDDITWGE